MFKYIFKLALGSQMPFKEISSTSELSQLGQLKFGILHVCMYITIYNYKSFRFMSCVHHLEFNETSIASCQVCAQARSFHLLYKWGNSFFFTHKRVLGVLAAALYFDCEVLIHSLLIELTVGRARAVTVRSWHPGMEPDWTLQGSKSACQEMGPKVTTAS